MTAREMRAARRLRRAMRLQAIVRDRECALFLAGALDVLPCRGLREAALIVIAQKERRK